MSASTAALARTARSSALEIVRENFQRANAFLRLPSELAVMLSTPQRELRTEIPLLSKDGPLKVFAGYRIQHNAMQFFSRRIRIGKRRNNNFFLQQFFFIC